MTVSELEQSVRNMKKNGEINDDTVIDVWWFSFSEFRDKKEAITELFVENDKLILKANSIHFYEAL